MGSEREHTPEPWKAKARDWRGEPSPYRLYVSGGAYLEWDDEGEAEVATSVAIVEGNATSREVTRANAARIVACVNALAGIGTTALEIAAEPQCQVTRLCRLVVAIEEAIGGRTPSPTPPPDDLRAELVAVCRAVASIAGFRWSRRQIEILREMADAVLAKVDALAAGKE